MANHSSDIDRYIDTFPESVQTLLGEIRDLIAEMAPDADETISYKIPAYKLDGKILMYFAGWRDHVSVYPIPPGDADFEEELTQYRHGKGTARFSLGEPLPTAFLRRFIELHIARIR